MNEVIRFEGRRQTKGPGMPTGRRRSEGEDDLNIELAKLPLTDLGNAERFERRYAGKFLWCGDELGWCWWDGVRWNFDNARAKVMQAAHATVRAIQDESASLRESESDILIRDATKTKPELWLSGKVAEWGRQSENSARLKSIAEQAFTKMSARPDEMDADPMKLTVLNGTLHFRRPSECPDGEDLIQLRPHDPADRITKLAPVEYRPDATCAQFDDFLGTTHPDFGQRRFLRQWFGYSLTGLTGEQKFVFLYGKGKNGKSTLVDLVAKVSGDYSDTVGIETFLDQGVKKKGSEASPDLAALKGVRFLRTSEPEKRSKLATAFIKLVTGGEPLKVRFLNKEFFTLRPSFKLTISGNYRPDITDVDEGIWRRFVLIPCLVQIPKADIDPELPEKLILEASGVLNWMLDGLRDWLENRLVIPDSVTEATQNYRDDSDPLGRFLELCVESAPGQRVQSSVMHRLFVGWCRASGEAEWTNKGFSAALKERGYRAKQSNVMWWLDVMAVKSESDFLDGSGHVRREDDGDDHDGRPFAPHDDEV